MEWLQEKIQHEAFDCVKSHEAGSQTVFQMGNPHCEESSEKSFFYIWRRFQMTRKKPLESQIHIQTNPSTFFGESGGKIATS